jgi:hypothetical protein
MASWTIFNDLLDVLVTYFFGSVTLFSVTLLAFMLVLFLAVGMPVRYAFPSILPLAAGLSLAGFFGAEGWIINLILIVVGLIYAYTVIRLTS